MMRQIKELLGINSKSKLPIPPVIVNTPGYNELTGGRIVMHYLVDRLRSFGIEAYVYPWVDEKAHREAMEADEEGFSATTATLLEHYALNPEFNTSVATYRDLQRCIAVYPLRVKRNPLQGETVIRWNIYRKSLIPDAEFSENEIHFFYNEDFFEGPGTFDKTRMLRLTYEFSNYYNQSAETDRSVECYMIRKGQSHYDEMKGEIPKNALCVDGLNHSDTAEVFKRSRFFYCFDLYTAYEYYAAVCGCIPIIVPKPGMSRIQWRKNEEDRYGVAYGKEDIDWAVDTRDALLERQRHAREEEMKTVENFAKFLTSKYQDTRIRARPGSIFQLS